MRTEFPVLSVNVASGRVRYITVYLHTGEQVPATHQAALKGGPPVRRGPRAETGAEQEGQCQLVTGGGLARGLSRHVSLDCVEAGVVSQERKDGRRGRFGEAMKV